MSKIAEIDMNMKYLDNGRFDVLGRALSILLRNMQLEVEVIVSTFTPEDGEERIRFEVIDDNPINANNSSV